MAVVKTDSIGGAVEVYNYTNGLTGEMVKTIGPH
jgi:hypothetical protein